MFQVDVVEESDGSTWTNRCEEQIDRLIFIYIPRECPMTATPVALCDERVV